MRHLDEIFRVNDDSGYSFCPSLFETVDIRVSSGNISDFPLFTVGS
jgi:hypothetical protein